MLRRVLESIGVLGRGRIGVYRATRFAHRLDVERVSRPAGRPAGFKNEAVG